jgi:cobaltochelatase CobS
MTMALETSITTQELDLPKKVKTTKIEVVFENGKKEVELLMKNHKDLVPTLNENYIFNSYIYDILEDIREDQRVCLVGHTGCGKTSSIEQLAARINQAVLRVNLNGQLTIGDFVGMWTVKGGETVWIDGVLPKAMKNGYWLILDELDYGDTGILSILNSVLEKNGKLMLKEKGHELITPHKDFRIFATGNTIGCMQTYRHMYQGTNIMNEAFIDRFRVYKVDYMKPDQEQEMLLNIFKNKFQEKNSLSDKELAAIFKKHNAKINDLFKRMVSVASMVRELFEKGEIDGCTFSTRRLIDWTEMTSRHENPFKAANNCVFSKLERSNKEIIEGVMIKHLPKKEDLELLFKKLAGDSSLTQDEEREEMRKVFYKLREKSLVERKLPIEKVKEERVKMELPQSKAIMESFIDKFVMVSTDIRKLKENGKIDFELKSEILLAYVEEAFLNIFNQKTKGNAISLPDALIEGCDKVLKPLMKTQEHAKIIAVLTKLIDTLEKESTKTKV